MTSNLIHLKEHNLETYNIIKNKFKERNHLGTVQATGTGKSYIIAKTIQDMNPKKTLFLTSSLHIINEFKDNFSLLTNNIMYMTYKKLTYISDLKDFLEREDFDFIVLDEYHRCGAKTWGKSVKELLSLYKDKKVLGTTATPIRYLDSCRDMTKELFDSKPVIELSLLNAIEMDILPKPKYVLSYYDVNADMEKLKKRANLSKDKNIIDRIQFIINNVDKFVNAEHVLKRNMNDSRKFIVFCSNINHAKKITPIVSTWFKNLGFDTKSYSLYTDTENPSKLRTMRLGLKEFKESKPENNEVHLLFSVNILNEGVHIHNVDGLIFLRKTTSPIIMYQQLGRALKSGDKKSPVIFDFVHNISRLSFIGNKPIFDKSNSESSNEEFEYFIDGSIEVIDYRETLDNLLKDIEELSIYSDWNSFIKSLEEFIDLNGHCNVPATHKLYKRCLSLRKDYENGVLDIDKFQELNNLGFKWDIGVYNEELWEEMFNRLVEFIKVHKHASVPPSYSDKKLATWVHTQRRFKDTMPIERKERLLSVGFEFEVGKKKNEKEWFDMYSKLLKFKEEFKHVNVSSRYEDKKLANWVSSQRKAYKAGKMSETRYNLLLEVGFKFPEKSS